MEFERYRRGGESWPVAMERRASVGIEVVIFQHFRVIVKVKIVHRGQRLLMFLPIAAIFSKTLLSLAHCMGRMHW